jgi:diguanylate cyclase (GGDEF)-like protein
MNAIPHNALPTAPAALRVLLFEDNALDAALVKKFLQTVGLHPANIHHVDTIPAALQILTREDVHVCLADYYLRPSTGFDLMDEARRNDVDVPFIMLTAMDDRSVDDGALQRGAYGFLVKGDLTVEGLERAIRYALVQHQRNSQLAREAVADGLTGLPNRKAFYERLQRALADNAGRGGLIGVSLFNVNGTKFINESFGTTVGDDVLRAVAQRLRTRRRPGDFLARIGGDEFAVLMTRLVLPNDAVAAAKAFADGVTGAVETRDGEHQVTIAGGVATLTVPKTVSSETGDRLMLQASQAMLNAKLASRMRGMSDVAVARLQ